MVQGVVDGARDGDRGEDVVLCHIMLLPVRQSETKRAKEQHNVGPLFMIIVSGK